MCDMNSGMGNDSVTTSRSSQSNETAMRSLQEHPQSLSATKVTAHLLPGLAHDEELTRVDDVLAPMRDFTLSRKIALVAPA